MMLTQLAEAANVPRNVIIDFEARSVQPRPEYLDAMRRVLQERRVEFVDGDPPGVRLKV
jgi:hypothetical protein